jgi:hypothetical protein
MKFYNIIGIAMIISPFAYLFCIACREVSAMTIIKAFTAAVGITAFMWLAVYLTVKD